MMQGFIIDGFPVSLAQVKYDAGFPNRWVSSVFSSGTVQYIMMQGFLIDGFPGSLAQVLEIMIQGFLTMGSLLT
jgi:hypothetical protein